MIYSGLLSALTLALNRSFARPLFALLLMLWLLPAPPLQAQTAATEQDIRTLELGKPVERELAGSQSHAYQITLAQGQYLNLVVEQRGIDVVVTVFAPDGKRLPEAGGPTGDQGPQPLAWIAEIKGTYRLEVRSLEKGAKAGRYEAKVIELRTAIANDRAQIEKALALQEAAQLDAEATTQNNAGQYDKALPLVLRTLAIYEKALGAEHPFTATSLNNLALLYISKGDYAKAEPLHQRALAIREKALGAEHPDTAQSLNNLALLYRSKGDNAKAEPLYQRALAIREKALGAEHPSTANSLNNLAALYEGKGDYAKAEPLYQRALAIREKALGAEHPSTATSLNNLANLYSSKGDYAKAEPLYQRVLAINEKALGAEHPATATSLNNLAFLYYRKGDYVKAEPLYQRALAIYEKALGAEHPSTAISLNNLAELYESKRDYAQAEPLLRRALAIREKALGAEHPSTATSLNNLAFLYYRKGDYVKAEPLYQRALAIREKVLGAEHPATATLLNNLALLYDGNGDYDKAEEFHQRALAIREKVLGPEHLDVANSLASLAFTYSHKINYAKAILLEQRALAIKEKALGPQHSEVLNILYNLAIIYKDNGDYYKAEPLYQRLLAIYEKRDGPESGSVGDILHRLASTYYLKGDYAKAELLYQRALAILEKTAGPQDPQFLAQLNNLANIYTIKGDYVKAEPLYQRVLAIREKAVRPEGTTVVQSYRVAQSLHSLAGLYRDKGDYTKAEPLYQRALVILEKTLGPENPDVARCLSELAYLYKKKGDYVKADPLYQRALAIREKALGAEHPLTASSLNELALFYDAKGDVAQAIVFRSRANTVEERNIALNTQIGSERQKAVYLATFTGRSEATVSLHARSAPNNAVARDLALTVILQRKGRALDAMTDSIAALRRRANPLDQALLDQLQEANAQLARLVLKGPQRITPAEHQKQIKALEERKENLEGEISIRSAEFRAQSQSVTLTEVQAVIPANAALVEFFAYRPRNAKYTKADEQFSAPRYVAYVLHQQRETQWVELGEAKAINEAVEKLRQALRDKRRRDFKRLARAVDEKVMRPVRALLGQTRRVFISPDGALNLIPFAALVDERNRYLIQRYTFSYLTSGRDFLRLRVKQPNKQTAMVVANPDFGEEAKAGAAQQRLLVYRPGTKAATGEGAVLAGYYFPPLRGTAREARALKAMLKLKDARVLLQAQATEAALKQVSSPRILHIATHGFFLENQQPSSGEDRLLRRISLEEPEPVVGQIENPLLRAGLALAGANLGKGNDEDDGILTAQEAAGLDLWGTKLVVLSACDTGVGEVKNGEGVYGLRRALVLAGSETQVMSLWPVSDLATRDLMIGYYRRLLAGEGRTEALRRVQLQMLNSGNQRSDGNSRRLVTKNQSNNPAKDGGKKDRSHPYYWASFIQSGEWANLEGKREDK